MKLVRLLPDQIMRFWAPIKTCILAALPPHVENDEDSILQIQERLLTGRLHCWIATADNNQYQIFGVMTTYLDFDPITNTKNLLIYTVAIISEHSSDIWEQAAIIVKEYAKKTNCYKIIAYSNNPQMIHISEKLGADSSYRLLTFEI